MSGLTQSVRKQIDAADLKRNRPLVICDVDEVVVHFIRSLEQHLEENGYWLDAASYALNGNVRRRDTNEPVPTRQFGDLLFGCFQERTRTMEPIEGAVRALERISAHAEIIMLTNLPEDYLEARVANLQGHGMPYPVVANSGPKGPAVSALVDGLGHHAVFIDDSPSNIASVGDHCPDVHLVHFIPDARFARYVEPIEGVALRSDNWPETDTFMHDLIVHGRAG